MHEIVYTEAMPPKLEDVVVVEVVEEAIDIESTEEVVESNADSNELEKF